MKFIFKIIDTDTFKRVNLTYNSQPDSECGEFTFLSDDYWRCKFGQEVMACTHMVGTCSMGSDTEDSTTSVVDTKFRFRI